MPLSPDVGGPEGQEELGDAADEQRQLASLVAVVFFVP